MGQQLRQLRHRPGPVRAARPAGDTGRRRLPVTIVNTVTGLSLVCEVPTPGGEVPTYGARQIPGQYYPGVPVDIIFESSSWTSFETELPTGNPIDEVTVQGRTFHATLIDAGAPAAIFDHATSASPAGKARKNSSSWSTWRPRCGPRPRKSWASPAT